MKEEGILSPPKPLMPSPQTILSWKEPAFPTGPGMLRMSPQVVLKNPLS